MANFTTVPTRNPGDSIASADWNTYVRDNFSSLAGLIMYYNGAAPSGTTEFTAARGLFICGLVNGGTLATAVGTPLTNQQNVTHTHSVTVTGWSHQATSSTAGIVVISTSSPLPAATDEATAAPATGTATAGSIGMPYMQLRVVSHV